jgi:hypothetical protein
MFNFTRKAQAPCPAPIGKCSLAKKVRTLTFYAEGYLSQGARRLSWTILKAQTFILSLPMKKRTKQKGLSKSLRTQAFH